MEIKHTIEILTKDIQDIGKLVGNLQNSKDGSSLELDLALSKLRNVYEILTMIKADSIREYLMTDAAPEVVENADSQVSAESGQEMKEVAETVPEPVPETASEPVPESSTPKSESREAEIIAEKYSAESSINENLAGKRGKDLDTKLTGNPIDNIGRNIGINDRFLIIRELLDGDADRFTSLVDNLEVAGSYQNAVGVLEAQFSDSMEHEGIEILAGLIKRRYTQP